jgi:hypothetical protein
MLNFKMVSLKEYPQKIHQMVSIGALIQKAKNTALRFSQTMIISSWRLTRFARDSTRKRPSRSLKEL